MEEELPLETRQRLVAASGRAVRVEVVETLRRGGKTCHFVARLA
jgi:hypothetical protein